MQRVNPEMVYISGPKRAMFEHLGTVRTSNCSFASYETNPGTAPVLVAKAVNEMIHCHAAIIWTALYYRTVFAGKGHHRTLLLQHRIV